MIAPIHVLPLTRAPGRLAVVAIGLLALATSGRGGVADEVGGFFKERLESVRLALHEGEPELYVTGYTWHLPWTYDRATRTRLNSANWGGGIGRSHIDRRGDQNSVFFLAFSDSHRQPQFILSYGWQRPWLANREWGLSWGYMAFLFSREDVAHHFPLPAVLPSAAVRWRRLELVGLFVPRVSRDIKGDVFFLLLRARR
jgi:lipid IVA palmitoyltransferase